MKIYCHQSNMTQNHIPIEQNGEQKNKDAAVTALFCVTKTHCKKGVASSTSGLLHTEE